MLAQLRKIVCRVWSIAEQLEEKGIGKMIPIVPEDSDIRHVMKAEVIVNILGIAGEDNLPNDDQIAFLQYVLHAPINKANREEFVESIKKLSVTKISSLLPYLILLDRYADMELATVYLEFLSSMSIGYMKCAEDITLDMTMRYISFMMKNKSLIETGYEKEIDFEPLETIDANKKEMIAGIWKLNQKTEMNNEAFLAIREAIKCAVEGEKKVDESIETVRYRKFKETIQEDDNTDKEQELRTAEEIIEELYSLVGLDEVKMQVQAMFNLVQIRKECENRGISRQPMSYHMVFSGNPGTGKTTVARLVAEAYRSIGLLSKGHLVEVSRADLVAGYVGHTALKVQEVLKKVKGGVLFIDEAYSLTSHSENDFGHEAVETLIKGMEDNRDDMIVIVAGYPDLMNEFMNSNPGLSSRFSKTIYFPDYTGEELTEIFRKFCKNNNVNANKNILEVVQRYLESEVAYKNKNFGNARMVRNYFEQVLINQANRLVKEGNITDTKLCNLVLEDIPAKIIIDKVNFFNV